MPDKPDLNDSPFDKALKGVSLNPDALKKTPQYRPIPGDTIESMGEEDPDAADLFRFSNSLAEKLQQQAEGLIPRERKHDTGWTITIETPEGNVGLRNPLAGVAISLKYPKDAPGAAFVTEELIKKTLEIKDAEPVKLEHGGTRKFASFYGPQEPDGGRVYVIYTDDIELNNSANSSLPLIKDEEVIEIPPYPSSDKYVSTLRLRAFSDKMPDGPTDNPEAIQKYRPKFIDLASKIAFFLGGAKSITIGFEILMAPEDLIHEGYAIKERDGNPELEEKFFVGKKGDATVILQNNKKQITWGTFLHIPTTEVSSSTILADVIKEDLLHF